MKRLFEIVTNLILTTVSSLFLAFVLSGSTAAVDFSLPLYDKDDRYFEKLLRAALAAADGEHSLTVQNMTMTQSRVIRSLLSGRSPVNVVYTGHSIEREALMRQIDIPLSMGLLGYRVFLIREDSKDMFSNISTMEELTSRISVGSGTGWPDTSILRSVGFNVKTGSAENLWQMLLRKRFMAFPRGLNEVLAELDRHRKSASPIAVMVEETVMLHYKYCQFFYVAPEDETRANIIHQGLERIHKNGTFRRILEQNTAISRAVASVKKYNRKIIEIANPLNSERIKAIPDEYWLDLRRN